MVHRRYAALVLGGLALGGCGSAAAIGRLTAPRASRLARWSAFAHVRRPLDIVGPRADGSLVLAAAGRLWLVSRGGAVTPFASGYQSPGGEEPYIAQSPGGCFGAGNVYALRLTAGRGVVVVGASGQVRKFAGLRAPGLIDAIAFDRTGRFGHRLLVTINAGSHTTVASIGCDGRVRVVTRGALQVEGGIAVAPASFGRFAGDLIASGENSGKIYAVAPSGSSALVADSGLPHGGDIGVESEGFVPAGRVDAFVADRLTPGNRHPGDDVVLRIGSAALRAAGVRAGDLLVGTEGGALTDDVRCTLRGCSVRYVADGPPVAHLEGHIAFRSFP